jgi:hexosaminidase
MGIMLLHVRAATLRVVLPLLALYLPAASLSNAASVSRINVWPLPASSSTGKGDTPLCLSPDFTISFDESLGVERMPGDLVDATRRTERNIRESRHAYLSPTGGKEFFNRGLTNASKVESGCRNVLTTLVLSLDLTEAEDDPEIASIFSLAIAPVESRPALEAYHLFVPLNGQAVLTSKTALGLFRGLTTFEQQWYHLPLQYLPRAAGGQSVGVAGSRRTDEVSQHPLASTGQFDVEDLGTPASQAMEKGRIYAPFAPYEISDKPAFGWRAVLLDTSRHFFSIQSILKVSNALTSSYPRSQATASLWTETSR